jgi:hypothetical protein
MQAVVQQLLDVRHPALGFIEDSYFNRYLDAQPRGVERERRQSGGDSGY